LKEIINLKKEQDQSMKFTAVFVLSALFSSTNGMRLGQ